ncbi:unnamed protein product [Trichogramma brassicae]|uniref:Retrotransposon gag domain-containing protein n=1 Tax=Trichogramma brassicae TaxID=86971 RepID=A0A6H5IA09_9HYME|nr:unnamed protein product [Trichogramma brassicae]
MDLDDSTKRKYKLYESIEELNEESRVAYLEELELKSDGDRDFQEQILINRLKGNYTANDFAPSNTAGDEATHRATRDEKLMNLTTKLNLDMTEHDDTSTSDEHEETANRTVLNEDNIRADVGAIVRKWEVEFNGEKGSSVDEFIQRVDECRRLARLSDEDLLNSITELLTGQARLWCRQERSQWKRWEDFCIAARRCYGIDRRYQQKLELEAQRRTQGRTEPVNHYDYCLLTIIGELAEPWTLQRKLDLLYNNMLPSLQKQVPRYKALSIDEFIELARDAENLHSTEKLYEPPIPSNLSMMPETAWDEPEAREKPSATKLASLSEPIDDIAKMMIELDQKLQGLTTAITAAASAAGNRTSTKKRTTSLKNKANADRAKSTRKPASDKNKNREAGPQAQVACWGCSWPGYIRPRCPDCSGNAKKEE